MLFVVTIGAEAAVACAMPSCIVEKNVKAVIMKELRESEAVNLRLADSMEMEDCSFRRRLHVDEP